MISESLKQLGFTQNQSTVYLALMELGNTKVGAIIERTGLHRNIVYTVLQQLLRRKLVNTTKQQGITYYAITNPKVLAEEFKAKYEFANEIVHQLATPPVGRPEVFNFIGEDGILEYLKLMFESKQDIYTIGANYRLFNKHEKLVRDYLIQREKDNVKLSVLAYVKNKKDAELFPANVRFLSSSFPQSPLVIDIFGDYVVQFVWQEPVVISIIKHKAIADGYRKYFQHLWELSKENV